jgi:hypothetical protein
MRRPRGPIFLERRSYRQRRLRDAARFLPILGAGLWMVPLLFGLDGVSSSTSSVMLYVFGVWVLLAVLSALLSLGLDPQPGPGDESAPSDEQAD